MWRFKIFSVIYFLAVCADQDNGNPPTPILNKDPGLNLMYVGETVTFTCKVSVSSGWTYVWYKDGNELTTTEEINRIRLDLSDRGHYSCKAIRGAITTDRSNVMPLNVLEIPVPVLSRGTRWSDVFPTENVKFSCKMQDSLSWTYTWYRGGQVIQPDNTVSFDPDTATLSISSASDSHAGQYMCKGFLSNRSVNSSFSSGLDLTVYDKKPSVTLTQDPEYKVMFTGEQVSFTCGIKVSSGWKYEWYRDSTLLTETSNKYLINSVGKTDSGSYTCKAKRGSDKFFHTDSSQAIDLQIEEIPVPVLSRSTQWSDMFPTENVKFSCKMQGSLSWTYTWYRDGQVIQPDNTVSFDPDKATLSISSASDSHAGQYMCKGFLSNRSVNSSFSSGLDLTVYDKKPNINLSQDPEYKEMFIGEQVSFTCGIKVSSGWEYEWYRDSTLLTETSNKYLINSVGKTDSGSYTCKAKRGSDKFFHTDSSQAIHLQIEEIPVPVLSRGTRWSDVFPTENVKFSCKMQGNLSWTYTWYRDGQVIQPDNTVSFNPDKATLSISSASDSHAGQYMCKGFLSSRSVNSSFSSGLDLTVYDKKPNINLTQDPEYKEMFIGEQVSFTCGIKVSSGWEYEWYRDSTSLTETSNKYLINSVGKTDSGSYTCKAKRRSDKFFHTDSSQAIHLQIEEIPVPVLRRGTRWSDVFPTENVKFSCKMQGSLSWTYTWYRGGQVIQPDNTVSFNPDKATLSISSASDSHAGQYMCKGFLSNRSVNSRFSSGLDLTVYDKKPSVTLTQDPEYKVMFTGEQVSFTCGINVSSGWEYEWYRDSTLLTETSNKYLINSVGKTDSGSYTCKAKRGSGKFFHTNSSQDIHLKIEDKKPSVTLTQDPEYKVMFTGEQVSFTCGINVSSGWKYEWYRDSTSLAETSNKYLINSVGKTDSGSYTCKAKRGSDKFFHTDSSPFKDLEFKERPKAIILALTGWSEVFSTDSLVLKCQVEESQDAWNYTWFKAGEPIILQASEKHTATPQNDPEQSAYTCRGIRTGRPSYSEESSSFTTKNLLLKRRLLLSISGCLFFGIIAVFIGCIVLRVIRKPVDDYEKPEEAELFLTMAQLKDRSDTPSPLVAYITDENLKAPSQAGDENDTTCNESAPITSEDQAVTTESVDKEENNAAMVSFKQ